MMPATSLIRSLVLSALVVIPAAGFSHASQEATGVSESFLRDISISFKLDPRLTRGTYMGDRWVSPPTYTSAVREGEELTIEARAEGLDSNGNPIAITPKWIPVDPEMVGVTPIEGKEVKITIRRAGQSGLKVVSSGFSKELIIKAAHVNNATRVEISPVQTSQAKGGIKGQREKLSYSLGYDTGRSMRNNSVDLDPDVYSNAFREGLTGNKAAMSDQEMGDLIRELNKRIMVKKSDQKKELAEKNKLLAEKNKKEGEAFLADNRTKEGVVTLPSGLQYKVLKEGNGRKPTESDTVECHYRVALIDGTEVDKSESEKPATFKLTGVIPGWKEALQLMPEGSKWQLFIPPHLAYGEKGGGTKIRPNATLVFVIELISVKKLEKR